MDPSVSPKLFIGIDVHKRQQSVLIFTSNCHHKTFSQVPYPEALKSYLDKFFPKHEVLCCYEACKFGFSHDHKVLCLLPEGKHGKYSADSQTRAAKGSLFR